MVARARRFGDYRAALERQLSWLRWNATTDADSMWKGMDTPVPGYSRRLGAVSIDRHTGTTQPASVGMRPDFVRPLLYGDVFFVAPNICEAVARKVQADPIPDVGFDVNWLLADHGFVVLGSPLQIGREFAGLRMDERTVETSKNPDKDFKSEIVALGWSVLEGGKAVQVVTYAARHSITVKQGGVTKVVHGLAGAKDRDSIRWKFGLDDVLDAHEVGFFPMASFAVDIGHTWRAVTKMFYDDATARGFAYPDNDIGLECPFFFGLVLFMLDRRSVVRRERLPRADRRRADREKEVPTEHIQVVILRAEEEAFEQGRDSTIAPRHIDWKWRWPVREHTRRHPVTGEKTVKVREYVKGPADRPLRKADSRRVFAVIR